MHTKDVFAGPERSKCGNHDSAPWNYCDAALAHRLGSMVLTGDGRVEQCARIVVIKI